MLNTLSRAVRALVRKHVALYRTGHRIGWSPRAARRRAARRTAYCTDPAGTVRRKVPKR